MSRFEIDSDVALRYAASMNDMTVTAFIKSMPSSLEGRVALFWIAVALLLPAVEMAMAALPGVHFKPAYATPILAILVFVIHMRDMGRRKSTLFEVLWNCLFMSVIAGIGIYGLH